MSECPALFLHVASSAIRHTTRFSNGASRSSFLWPTALFAGSPCSISFGFGRFFCRFGFQSGFDLPDLGQPRFGAFIVRECLALYVLVYFNGPQFFVTHRGPSRMRLWIVVAEKRLTRFTSRLMPSLIGLASRALLSRSAKY